MEEKEPPFSQNQLLLQIFNLLKNHFENRTPSRENGLEFCFSSLNGSVKFLKYLENNIQKNYTTGNISAGEKLKSTCSRFKNFLSEEGLLIEGDIPFIDITPSLMKKFEQTLKGQMLSMNTISFYMRILRMYYNRALNEKIFDINQKPFEKVYTGISRTKKRAIGQSSMRAIKDSSLPDNLVFARDIFLFSFYTRGMSYVDIAHLREENIRGKYLKYYRRKTGQEIQIAIEPCIQEIIDKYRHQSGCGFLFPIKFRQGSPVNYNSFIRMLNRHLRQISTIAGLKTPVSSYVARHSWASIAKKNGVSIITISESMGHTSEKTTQIYLTSLNQNTIDEANRKIIKSI